MANRQKGELSLDLPDGRSYTLVMNTNAMAAIEEKTGGGWDAFFERVSNPSRARIQDLRLVVWGMTRKYHPELTIEQIGDLIDEVGGASGMSALIGQPVSESVTPDPKDVTSLEVPARPTKASPKRTRRTRGGAASIYRPVRSA